MYSEEEKSSGWGSGGLDQGLGILRNGLYVTLSKFADLTRPPHALLENGPRHWFSTGAHLLREGLAVR